MRLFPILYSFIITFFLTKHKCFTAFSLSVYRFFSHIKRAVFSRPFRSSCPSCPSCSAFSPSLRLSLSASFLFPAVCAFFPFPSLRPLFFFFPFSAPFFLPVSPSSLPFPCLPVSLPVPDSFFFPVILFCPAPPYAVQNKCPGKQTRSAFGMSRIIFRFRNIIKS